MPYGLQLSCSESPSRARREPSTHLGVAHPSAIGAVILQFDHFLLLIPIDPSVLGRDLIASEDQPGPGSASHHELRLALGPGPGELYPGWTLYVSRRGILQGSRGRGERDEERGEMSWEGRGCRTLGLSLLSLGLGLRL